MSLSVLLVKLLGPILARAFLTLYLGDHSVADPLLALVVSMVE